MPLVFVDSFVEVVKQPNGWFKSNILYWVTVGSGELEGGDAFGVFNGDAGAEEFDNGDELGAESCL